MNIQYIIAFSRAGKPMFPEGKGFYLSLDEPGSYYYEGWFQNKKKQGKGRRITKEKHIYTGDWVEDRRTGKANYQWPDGDEYEGDFLNDDIEGFGKTNRLNSFN